MKYIYTAAWTVIGGISLKADCLQTVLVNSENSQFILTREPDALLAKVDEATAVGRLLLDGGKSADYRTMLVSEIESIKAERKKKAGEQTVLLFQAQGEIDAMIKAPIRENETFIVAFDAVDKSIVRQLHQSDIEAMKVAVALDSDAPSHFAYLTDGTYLLNESGKPIYSFTPSLSAEMYIMAPVSEDTVQRIAARYAILSQENDFDSIARLFSQMAEYGTDRLKTFLSGWMALEILIAKAFKNYEQAVLSACSNAVQPILRERFLTRIQDVMKDRYRLTDKFIAVTAVLFPSIDDAEAEKIYADFRSLKQLRDSILHGEPFSEKDLPVHELAALLRRYFVARIAASDKVLNKNLPTNSMPFS